MATSIGSTDPESPTQTRWGVRISRRAGSPVNDEHSCS